MIAFGTLGFAFGPFIPMLIFLISFGFIGTIIGKRILKLLPEHIFSIGLKIILTLLALRLMYSAASKLA
jgi:uncharacterized membrane protein YfcA